MVKKKPKVVIPFVPKTQLKEAYEYIKFDSPKNAEKVRSKILAAIKELADHPERHSPDKYRMNNDGSYRAFEIYKYRVTYHVSPDQITIVRVLHTKREPKAY
jgi:plasmid stabilization system protein ParE